MRKIVLIVVMTASIILSCYAQFGGGNGSEASPWRIENAQHLDNIRNYVGTANSDKYFMQTRDIDLGVPPYNAGEGWMPISGNIPFMGNYDGRNFEIKNLTISRNSHNQSLFGNTAYATISSLKLLNVNVSGERASTGLASTVNNTIIRNVTVKGNVSGTQHVSGIAAIAHESTITNSYSTGSVTGASTQSRVGGLISSASNSFITNCYSSMTVFSQGTNASAGGLIASFTGGRLENSLATGSVSSIGNTHSAGGLIAAGTGTVINSFWNIESTGQHRSGGGEGITTEQAVSRETFAANGWSFPHIWDIVDEETYPYLSWQGEPGTYNRPGPYNLRATGFFENEDILLEWDMIGDPVGYRLYRNDLLIGTLNHPQMSWLDENVEMLTHYTYHVIAIIDAETQSVSARSNMLQFGLFPFAGGTGTEDDPYQVANAEHLDMVRLLTNAYFIQTADLNLGEPPWNPGQGWVPIDSFTGHYNGNGYVISGLTINRDDGGQALFGYTRNAVFMNVALEDVDITGRSAGALATHSQMTTVINCYATGLINSRTAGGLISDFGGVMINCWTDVHITATTSYIGGLVGRTQGEITNCYALGNIEINPQTTSYAIGGLAGSLSAPGGSIHNSYASGNVVTPLRSDISYRIGGFVGTSNGLISNSYASGDVVGGREVGGFVGQNYRSSDRVGTINNSYAAGKVQAIENAGGFIGLNGSNVNNCYSIGSVIGENSFGGFVGRNEGQVVNSFWNITTSENDGSAAGTGLYQEEMVQQDTFNNWNFNDTWSITTGISYPWLQWQQQPGRHNIAGPYNFQADLDNDNLIVELNWEIRGEPEYYRIYRNGEIINTVDHPATNYRDENLQAMFRYQYEVSAVFSVNDEELESMRSTRLEAILRTSFAGGDGSQANPYQVNSASSLSLVREYSDSCFIQTADIDLGVYPWNINEGWEPIGTSDYRFLGVYNGGGHKIRGLTINRPRMDNQSLFGDLGLNAEIRNIGLVNVKISGKNYVAGISHKMEQGSLIERSFVTGTIRGYDYAAAITGLSQPSSIIRDCYSTANIEITSTSANSYIGGLIAFARWSIIERCYSFGTITAHTTVSNAGAVIGRSIDSNHNSLYWNIETANIDRAIGNLAVFPGSLTADLLREVTYGGFDFDEVWQIEEDRSYAYLSWQEDPDSHNHPLFPPRNLAAESGNGFVNLSWLPPPNDVLIPDGYYIYREDVRLNDELIAELEYRDEDVDSWQYYSYYVTALFNEQETGRSNEVNVFVFEFAGGLGSAGEPFQVATAQQLAALSYADDAHYKLIRSLDMQEWCQQYGWEPIGTIHRPFKGSFDGNNYPIRNLSMNRTTGVVHFSGLFGSAEGAHLSNIVLENVQIVTISYTGAIVGIANNTNITNCHIDGSIVVTGTGGAVAGKLTENSLVSFCYSTGSIRANHSGSSTGGLVGLNDSSSITDSFSAMRVLGNNNYSGGLIAINRNGNVNNCFVYGLVTSTNHDPEFSGGLVGRSEAGQVINSYWDTEATRQDVSAGGEGRTTAEMAYPYSEQTYVDWDFENIWQQDITGNINNGYPYLKLLIKTYPDVAANPNPEDNATDISPQLEALSWKYLSSPVFEDPEGFRVYFNETGEFTEEDEYEWVDYVEGEEEYHCTAILPELDVLTTYYWKVVPTTNEPGERRTKGVEQRTESRERRDWSRRQNDKTRQLATRHSQLTTRGDAQNVPVWQFTTIDQTNIEEINELPLLTELQSNYPNPFNPATTISFSLAESGELTLEIFNIKGQKIVTLIDEHRDAGHHKAIWNGKDENNRTVGSGVYLYRMKTNDYIATDKMILMK